jgi:hypothetical protein
LGGRSQIFLLRICIGFTSGNQVTLFTSVKLTRLHRNLGHPSISRMHTILKRARPEDVDGLPEMLKEITENCEICDKSARSPRFFKIAVGTEELRFNKVVAIDVM